MSRATQKIEGTIENWESEKLGNDEAFAEIASEISSSSIDDMLSLQMISIRLQKSMIKDLKDIAKVRQLGGYQPLVRRILERFVEAEMKAIARESMSQDSEDSVSVKYDNDIQEAC
jgi:hypothetical protein